MLEGPNATPLVHDDFELVGGKGVVQSFKILVVDDFAEFRRFVHSLLKRTFEFQVIHASDGVEAVQKAVELRPDLILLDIALPNLNGIEVARQVRELALPAKVLFLSQEPSPEVVQEALRLGALGYVHKSRANGDLLPAIKAVLGGQRFVSSGLEVSQGTNAQAPHRHDILFCSDEDALLDGLTRFIGNALNAGNAAIVWATELHRESLVQRLRAQGVDVAAAIRRGTYILSDAAEKPDVVKMLVAIRGLREAASKAGKKLPRVAVCGERAGRLWAEGKVDEAMRLEQLLNELAKGHDIDILCPYPMEQGQEDNPALKSICAEHSAVSFR